MDELDTSSQRITRSYPTSLGDIRDDLKKQILLNHTGSRLSYNQIPLVHGRSVGARLDGTNGGGGVGAAAEKGGRGAAASVGGQRRMANHQRNLSLDFRSMGIVLPPVSQVTNTRVNLTQHHRNRSLDSALQGIPEVEVSSPSAELDKTICTNSLYGATMCSKVSSTSLYNGSTASTGHGCTSTATAAAASSSSANGGARAGHNEFGDWRDSSDKVLRVGMQTQSNRCDVLQGSSSCGGDTVVAVPNKSSSLLLLKKKNKKPLDSATVKKRDDLTCLGSDDSGIICNSEHEHPQAMVMAAAVAAAAAKKGGASRDSISSTGDEEMIEEHEEDDEMFSQEEEEDEMDRGISSRTPSEEAEEEEEEREASAAFESYESVTQRFKGKMKQEEEEKRVPSINSPSPESGAVPTTGRGAAAVRETMANGIKLLSPNRHDSYEITPTIQTTTTTVVAAAVPPTKDHKNDVIFKNFFGATKNAIFRTAQSIIENHEKKSSNKKPMLPTQPPSSIELLSSSPSAATEDQSGTPSPMSSSSSSSGSSNTVTMSIPLGLSHHHTPPTTTNTSPVVLSPVQEATTITTTHPPPQVIVAPPPKKREFFMLKPKMPVFHLSGTKSQSQVATTTQSNGSRDEKEGKKLPGSVHQYVIKEQKLEEESQPVVMGKSLRPINGDSSNSNSNNNQNPLIPGPPSSSRPPPSSKADHNGLLRFFESPIFNIHFAVHYLFYSKEPGVLMFIANKIFSFPDADVDLYVPQLVLMYTQMDELADILDSYLVYRCRKSVDFSLKCAWLLESYNLNVLETVAKQGSVNSCNNRVARLYLLRELYPKREKKLQQQQQQLDHHHHMLHVPADGVVQSPMKKTHHRSQSDATGLLGGTGGNGGGTAAVMNGGGGGVGGAGVGAGLTNGWSVMPKPLALGDLTTGRAFDNGCLCFVTVRGTVNDLRGQRTVCSCGAPKLLPEREFMKVLIDIGRTLTSLPTKSEKTTALRMFLNLINKNLPARVWLPVYSEVPHHVVRITEDKTAVLNSKDKTPYIIYVEVVEVGDMYTSPVMPKLMPTLRHTKSEEHLETALEGATAAVNGGGGGGGKVAAGGGGGGSGQQMKKELLRASLSGSGSGLRPEESEELEKASNRSSSESGFDVRMLREEDVWSQEDDEITAQYIQMQKLVDRDAVSQLSMESCDSKDHGAPVLFNIRDVRNRHCVNLNVENTKTFSNDPEDPSAAALKEPWDDKEKQIRMSSPYGHLPNWRLLSVIVKSGDDLRQELMATQLLQMFKLIWDEECVDLWVRPYRIVCLSDDSGLIEPILNTVSIHQIKKNSNKSLKEYFVDEYGEVAGERFQEAQRKFMQSCAAYCLISYLLQVKDRHNGNILLHSDGHLIHIDFGFILSISPKNLGFEQSPFKLTPEFVEVMGGPASELWVEFKHLLLRGLLTARKHMERIINIVEIMRSSSQLPCFKNGCSTTVRNLRNRFHMGLTEQELERKVEQLIQDSLNSLSTKLYDGYQYYTNGIL